MDFLLIGNSFPLNLINRDVFIKTETIENLRNEIKNAKEVYSFWGHENTVHIASKICGVDLRATGDERGRPRVTRSGIGLPSFGGLDFRECWILSPEYVRNFRPEIGEEVEIDMIKNWHVLRMIWI